MRYSGSMRIAAVQTSAVFDDLTRASDVIAQKLLWADGESVDLMLFPETYLLGHSYDRQTIVSRSFEATTTGLQTLCSRIESVRATLVVGTFEHAGDKVYNSAFVIERGRILGRYRKAYPNELGVSAGTEFPVFSTAGLRYGINICNDANHTDAADRIACQNAALIVFSLNNMLRPDTAARWREKSLANLTDRARQTGCWIASADVIGTADERMSFGCTAIIEPGGQVVSRVPELQEGIAVFDLPAHCGLSSAIAVAFDASGRPFGGAGPMSQIRPPMTCVTGRTLSIADGGPPASTLSSPLAATSGRPKTGADT